MVNIEALKNEIDTSKNEKIELQEMEEFLKSDENVKELGKAMEEDCNKELLEEYEVAIGDLCDKIRNEKKGNDVRNEITLNEFNILTLYRENFENNEEKSQKRRHKNIGSLLNKLFKDYYKQRKDYLNCKIDKKEIHNFFHMDVPNDFKGPVAEFIRKEKEAEKKLMDNIAENIINEFSERQREDIIEDTNKSQQEFLENHELHTKLQTFLDMRKTDNITIKEIINKSGKLSEEEKNKLLNFRDYYYELGHNELYKNENIKNEELKNMLGNDASNFSIIGYDNIANRIDGRLKFETFNLDNVRNIKTLQEISDWIKKYASYCGPEYDLLRKQILKKINKISNDNFKNDLPNLSILEIGRFQVRINLSSGENLKINGDMEIFDKTSTYIYRQRLCSENNQKLYIKNLNFNLILLDLKEEGTGDRIVKDFFSYYFHLKKQYPEYRNSIPSEFFKNVLILMSNSAAGEKSATSSLETLKKQLEDSFAQQKAVEEENKRIMEHNKKAEEENKLMEGFNREVNKILDNLNKTPKLTENAIQMDIIRYPTVFKNYYKDKVANPFITLRRKKEYKPFLQKIETLSSQIFIEIYCSWKDDGIQKIFGHDVAQECNKYIGFLDSFSENENKEHIDILNAYNDVSEANKHGGRCEENHYARKNPYYIDVDELKAREERAKQFPDTILTYERPQLIKERKEQILRVDDYRVGNNLERHSSPIGTVIYRDNPIRHYTQRQVIGQERLKPGTRKIQPDPHGWYAILPDRLKKKANQGKIKLAIINGNACIYEFEDGQDIKMRKYNVRTRQLDKDPTIIKAEDYHKALMIEANKQRVREAENGKEFNRIQEELNAILRTNTSVDKLFNEFRRGDLSGKEEHLLQTYSVQLFELTQTFCNGNNRDKLQNMKNSLQKLLDSNRNLRNNPYKSQIELYINNINKILEFATQKNLDRTRKLMNLCLNKAEVHENDNFYDKSRQEWVTLGVTFIAAIAITVVTCGACSEIGAGLVVTALASSAAAQAGSMVVGELMQTVRNADLFSEGSISVNGKTYQLTYNNPTLLQQALDPNSDVTARNAIKGYGSQFIEGTLTQAAFMWLGGKASQQLSNRMVRAQPGSFADKLGKFTCKLFNRGDIKTDSYTQGLFKSLESQTNKEGFWTSFRRELIEESGEETVENIADNIDPKLGFLAQIYNCIKPHPGMALETAGVTSPTLNLETGKNHLLVQTTYNGDNPNNITILKNYYAGLPGYTIQEGEGGRLIVTAKEVSIDGEKPLLKGSIKIIFVPSIAPKLVRSLDLGTRVAAGINVNDNSGEVTYNSKEQLEHLGNELIKHNTGRVEFNSDGTATLIIGNEKVTLIKSESQVTNPTGNPNETESQVVSNNNEEHNRKATQEKIDTKKNPSEQTETIQTENRVENNKENLNKFREIGIFISDKIYNDPKLKFSERSFDFKKLEELRKNGFIGKSINAIADAIFIKMINDLEIDFDKLNKLKDLGISIDAYIITRVNDLEIDFDKLNKLKSFGISIDYYDIEKAITIEVDFDKLNKLKEVGIIIDSLGDIEKFNNLGWEIDFEKLKKIQELGLNITGYDFFYGSDTIKSIMNLEIDFKKLKKLKEFGINISKYNIKNLNNLEIDFEILKKLKEDLGLNITAYNINQIPKLNLSDKEISLCKEYGITEVKDVVFFKHNIVNADRIKIKDFIKRKNEYLKNNRTLTEQRFIELFGGNGFEVLGKTGIIKKGQIGKYGKIEINQGGLGYCYAYTGFELLKKTNGFNELIQTNLRETENGWEVRLPFCDNNGTWIKINKEEIDKEFSILDEDGEERNVSINSESEHLGFKILEIAFIKKSIINKYHTIKNGPFGEPSESLKNAYNQFKNEGDLTITGELLTEIEGGITEAMIYTILPEDYIIGGFSLDGLGLNMKDLAFNQFSKGLYKIEIGIHGLDNGEASLGPNTTITESKYGKAVIVNDVKIINNGGTEIKSRFSIDNEGNLSDNKEKYGNNLEYTKAMSSDIVTNQEGKDAVMFFQQHAYSIERCYIDKSTGEKRVRVINPRHTGIKFDISLEQCKQIFDWNVTGINIDNMFRDKQTSDQSIDSQKENKSDYFGGKSHKIFEGNTGNTESNSKFSDKILSEINEQNKSEKLEELRKEIAGQYKQSTGEELELTDEQLLSILDAHEQDGKLGELTIGQLKQKVKVLNETITDPKIWRFLLEAGFCGKDNIIHGFFVNKLKELQLNDEEIDRILKNSKQNYEEHLNILNNIIDNLKNYGLIIKNGQVYFDPKNYSSGDNIVKIFIQRNKHLIPEALLNSNAIREIGSYLRNGVSLSNILNLYFLNNGKFTAFFQKNSFMLVYTFARTMRGITSKRYQEKYFGKNNSVEKVLNLILHLYNRGWSIMSSQTMSIIGDFKGGGYEYLNNPTTPKQEEAAQELSSFLNYCNIRDDITVMRRDYDPLCLNKLIFEDGTRLSEVLQNPNLHRDKLTQLSQLKGQRFNNNRFVSTTLKDTQTLPENSHGITINWTLNVKPGVGVCMPEIFAPINGSEIELILNRGSRYTIEDININEINGEIVDVNIKATVEQH